MGTSNFGGKKAAPFRKGGKRRAKIIAAKGALRGKDLSTIQADIDLNWAAWDALHKGNGWTKVKTGTLSDSEHKKTLAAAPTGHTVRVTENDAKGRATGKVAHYDKQADGTYKGRKSGFTYSHEEVAHKMGRAWAKGHTVEHSGSKRGADLSNFTGAEIDLDWAAFDAQRKNGGAAQNKQGAATARKTHNAVAAFQKAHGLPVTGHWGVGTLAAARKAGANGLIALVGKQAPRGRTVEAFQRAHGLPLTGRLDHATKVQIAKNKANGLTALVNSKHKKRSQAAAAGNAARGPFRNPGGSAASVGSAASGPFRKP